MATHRSHFPEEGQRQPGTQAAELSRGRWRSLNSGVPAGTEVSKLP